MWSKCKIIQLNEWGCGDAPCGKSRKSPLSSTTSTIVHNPSLHVFRQWVTHDRASNLDSIAKETLVSTIFQQVRAQACDLQYSNMNVYVELTNSTSNTHNIKMKQLQKISQLDEW